MMTRVLLLCLAILMTTACATTQPLNYSDHQAHAANRTSTGYDESNAVRKAIAFPFKLAAALTAGTGAVITWVELETSERSRSDSRLYISDNEVNHETLLTGLGLLGLGWLLIEVSNAIEGTHSKNPLAKAEYKSAL